jgi:hypothetical protein
MVSFIPTDYTVTEGNQVSITAFLTVPADRDLTIDFTTSDGTAIGMITEL